jgi:hypothetical protein
VHTIVFDEILRGISEGLLGCCYVVAHLPEFLLEKWVFLLKRRDRQIDFADLYS